MKTSLSPRIFLISFDIYIVDIIYYGHFVFEFCHLTITINMYIIFVCNIFSAQNVMFSSIQIKIDRNFENRNAIPSSKVCIITRVHIQRLCYVNIIPYSRRLVQGFERVDRSIIFLLQLLHALCYINCYKSPVYRTESYFNYKWKFICFEPFYLYNTP